MDVEADGNRTNTQFQDPESNDDLLEDVPAWTLKEIAVSALASVTVVVSICCVFISKNPLVIVTGVIGLLIPPYAAFQEQKITDIKGMYLHIDFRF